MIFSALNIFSYLVICMICALFLFRSLLKCYLQRDPLGHFIWINYYPHHLPNPSPYAFREGRNNIYYLIFYYMFICSLSLPFIRSMRMGTFFFPTPQLFYSMHLVPYLIPGRVSKSTYWMNDRCMNILFLGLVAVKIEQDNIQ